jgi:hypothetical protein
MDDWEKKNNIRVFFYVFINYAKMQTKSEPGFIERLLLINIYNRWHGSGRDELAIAIHETKTKQRVKTVKIIIIIIASRT